MVPILILVQLIALISVAACDTQIKQVLMNEAELVETSPVNYGMTALSLNQNNWKTVSVNNDDMVIYGNDCQTTLKKMSSLTESESGLLTTAKRQFDTSNGINLNGYNGRFSISTHSLHGGQSFNMNFKSFEGNSFSTTNFHQQGGNYAGSSGTLPNNLARVYIGSDVVTFVYLDGKVQTKPTACLQPSEQQLIQQLKVEYEAAEKKFKEDMAKFQQNMQDSMQNLQQNLSNMQNNMMNNLNWMNQQSPQQNYQQQQQQQYQQYQPPQQQFHQSNLQFQQPLQQQQQQQISSLEQQDLNPTAPIDTFNAPQSNFGPPSPYVPAPYVPNTNPFGNNFPFGPNNSPFGNNFPFGPNNSPFGNNFPFGPNNSPFGNGFPFGGRSSIIFG